MTGPSTEPGEAAPAEPALSVVIPCLNEADYLADTVRAARAAAENPDAIQWFVVDSGSTDDTVAVARTLPVTTVTPNPTADSRARACNAGIARATGDTVLFLDADSRLPPGFDRLITDALRDPDVVGGAFAFRMDGKSPFYRLVEGINRLRYRITRLYYSDQALFARRATLRELGGFPDVGIMASSRLCRLLPRHGRLRLLAAPVLTSPRRFEENGRWKVLLHDIRLWWREFAGRSNETFARKYRMDNLKRGG